MQYKIEQVTKNRIKLRNNKNYCAIIGLKPSKGARSPKIWNFFFKRKKLDYQFLPFDIETKNLKFFFSIFKNSKNIKSISITNPYKSEALKYIDKLNPEQKGIKSINLIKNINGKLIGYNTDIQGFYSPLKKNSLKKKSIFIYGAGGGVGKTLLFHLLKFNNHIYAYNRSISKVKDLPKKNKNLKVVKNLNEIKNIKKIDMFINCSSIKISKYQKSLQKVLSKIKIKIIYDINYNFKKIELKKIVNIYNSKIIIGKKMNFYQAMLAIKIVFPKYSEIQIKKVLLSLR